MELGRMYNNPSIKIPRASKELVCSSTHIGLELEVTGVNSNEIPDIMRRHYRCEADNSLRGNGHGGPMEFTFNRPTAGASIIEALDVLEQTFERTSSQWWELSNRGSTHVHLDVRDCTVDQLGWLVLMSSALEDYLFTINNSGYRQGSVFCRSLKALPNALKQAMSNIKAGPLPTSRDIKNHVCRSSLEEAGLALMFGEGVGTSGENMKYSATNLTAVRTFQSMEYRHFRPACTKAELLGFINPLLLLKKAAQASDPVKEFTKSFGKTAPNAVIELERYARLIEEI